MSETKAHKPITKQIHVTPETYKRLRHASVELDVRLRPLTEQVIEAGFRAILPDQGPAASPN